jgi:hypothetical protein
VSVMGRSSDPRCIAVAQLTGLAASYAGKFGGGTFIRDEALAKIAPGFH